jgi:exodeoxyribonuclease VII small subunit
MSEPSFEEALEQLEDSVGRLESGDLNLEEALQIFEQGIAASRICTRWLDQTRKRVQVLVADESGNLHLSFLDEEEDDAEEDT